jgi:hypothetical protein
VSVIPQNMATFAKRFHKNPLYYLHMILFCHFGMKIHPEKKGAILLNIHFKIELASQQG